MLKNIQLHLQISPKSALSMILEMVQHNLEELELFINIGRDPHVESN